MKIFSTIILLSLGLLLHAQKSDTAIGDLQLIVAPSISDLQQHYVNQNKKDASTEGYRIQIYNGNKSETLKKRSEFLSKFPEVPIYTLYEAPEYKAQAGNFRTRLEAEKFLNQVHQELGSAFIVKTKIQPPSL